MEDGGPVVSVLIVCTSCGETLGDDGGSCSCSARALEQVLRARFGAPPRSVQAREETRRAASRLTRVIAGAAHLAAARGGARIEACDVRAASDALRRGEGDA